MSVYIYASAGRSAAPDLCSELQCSRVQMFNGVVSPWATENSMPPVKNVKPI